MESLIVSQCAQPLLSIISMLTASVLSRARAMLRGRLWLSLWHPAQSREPWCLPGWSRGLLARGWLNAEVSPGNPVCLLGLGGRRAGLGVTVQVVLAGVCWPTWQVCDSGSAAGE